MPLEAPFPYLAEEDDGFSVQRRSRACKRPLREGREPFRLPTPIPSLPLEPPLTPIPSTLSLSLAARQGKKASPTPVTGLHSTSGRESHPFCSYVYYNVWTLGTLLINPEATEPAPVHAGACPAADLCPQPYHVQRPRTAFIISPDRPNHSDERNQ